MGFRSWFGDSRRHVTVEKLAEGTTEYGGVGYVPTGITFQAGILELSTREQYQSSLGTDQPATEIKLYADHPLDLSIDERVRITTPEFAVSEANVRNRVYYPEEQMVAVELSGVVR